MEQLFFTCYLFIFSIRFSVISVVRYEVILYLYHEWLTQYGYSCTRDSDIDQPGSV